MTTGLFSAQSTAPASAPTRRRAQIFAHRGASGAFAEHTRAAYLHALAEGADGLEIDVHLTKDGQVVCFHDETLDRTTDARGLVAERTLAELRRLDVCSWKTSAIPAEYGGLRSQLMTLGDTLELLLTAGRSVRLAIELKHPSPFGHQLEDHVLRTLLSYGWDPETSRIGVKEGQAVEVSFMSFHPGSLMHLADLVPAEKLCALFAPVTSEDVGARAGRTPLGTAFRPLISAVMRGAVKDAEALVWNRQVGIAGPGMSFVRAHRAEAKAWIARGAHLRVWTVDEPEDAQLLLSLGVQELTTNFPGRMVNEVSTQASFS
ncbi:glycerophosphodiester phosphodiesterase family protein [Nesterenkonia sp. NBAIMH1]|uniref:glycerophosphodiester phosphodiesterase n=1 Tax=Nesterenkonia sp. NBAIMH1 TaxID=2600320 RepID=UPI0011B82A17|nr:glycerophosphodiester phosphodiesterase family protein [Nesterenkonia sp. NBAIMH1]